MPSEQPDCLRDSAAELVSAHTTRAVGKDGASPRVRTGLSRLQVWGLWPLRERGAHRCCVQEKQTLGFRLSWAEGPVLSGPPRVGCSSGWGGSDAAGNLQSPGRLSRGLGAAVARGPSRRRSLGWLHRCPAAAGPSDGCGRSSLAAQHEHCHVISHYIVLYCSLCHRNNLSRFSHLGLQKTLSGSRTNEASGISDSKCLKHFSPAFPKFKSQICAFEIDFSLESLLCFYICEC